MSRPALIDLIVHTDYKSPYAYVAKDPTRALAL